MQVSTKELIVVESLNPVDLFAGDGLEPLLARIETEVRSYLLDISTDAGRKEVASVAFKVARSKTTLDKMGKDLGEEYRQKINALNAKRNVAVTRLESLQHEIRKPLTDWENAEKDRVKKHQDGINEIETLSRTDTGSFYIQKAIESLSDYHKRDWQEFDNMAKKAIQTAFEALTEKLEILKKREHEQEELARLRAAEQKRLQEEEQQRLIDEAVAKASAAGEAKRKEAAADAENAARAVQAKIEEYPQRQMAREKDVAHRAKVINEALEYLRMLLPEDLAKSVITAIAQGKVPHITINY